MGRQKGPFRLVLQSFADDDTEKTLVLRHFATSRFSKRLFLKNFWMPLFLKITCLRVFFANPVQKMPYFVALAKLIFQNSLFLRHFRNVPQKKHMFSRHFRGDIFQKPYVLAVFVYTQQNKNTRFLGIFRFPHKI